MTGSTLETVLRRDRLIVATALGAIVALAWAYLLWLAGDMSMGGMDMTGFRMIPAGMGLMAPAKAPWSAIEFAFVFAPPQPRSSTVAFDERWLRKRSM
jgi:predicted metal-binding membrane protein